MNVSTARSANMHLWPVTLFAVAFYYFISGEALERGNVNVTSEVHTGVNNGSMAVFSSELPTVVPYPSLGQFSNDKATNQSAENGTISAPKLPENATTQVKAGMETPQKPGFTYLEIGFIVVCSITIAFLIVNLVKEVKCGARVQPGYEGPKSQISKRYRDAPLESTNLDAERFELPPNPQEIFSAFERDVEEAQVDEEATMEELRTFEREADGSPKSADGEWI